MGVWAKLDGLRDLAAGQDVSINFAEVIAELKKPQTGKALNILGLSKGGLAEILEGNPLSNSKDRKIVSAILAIVATRMVEKKFD